MHICRDSWYILIHARLHWLNVPPCSLCSSSSQNFHLRVTLEVPRWCDPWVSKRDGGPQGVVELEAFWLKEDVINTQELKRSLEPEILELCSRTLWLFDVTWCYLMLFVYVAVFLNTYFDPHSRMVTCRSCVQLIWSAANDIRDDETEHATCRIVQDGEKKHLTCPFPECLPHIFQCCCQIALICWGLIPDQRWPWKQARHPIQQLSSPIYEHHDSHPMIFKIIQNQPRTDCLSRFWQQLTGTSQPLYNKHLIKLRWNAAMGPWLCHGTTVGGSSSSTSRHDRERDVV